MAYMVVFAESGILLVDQGDDRPKYYGKRRENPIPYFHHFHHFHALSTQIPPVNKPNALLSQK
jgi:hypothetical protein